MDKSKIIPFGGDILMEYKNVVFCHKLTDSIVNNIAL